MPTCVHFRVGLTAVAVFAAVSFSRRFLSTAGHRRRTLVVSSTALADRRDWCDLVGRISEAADRIRAFVRRTPVEESAILSRPLGNGTAFLKLESEQVTGSFKARGAVNKLCLITETARNSPGESAPVLFTASTGNHALAFAYGLRTVPGASSLKSFIYVPSSLAPAKAELLELARAPLVKIDSADCCDAEIVARSTSESTPNGIYVSPYNDEDIVAGQGTIGCEILDQVPDVDAIFVPVGGGGLIAGIALWIKAHRPQCRIIGCQPASNACMYESVRQSRILGNDDGWTNGETLSDGTSGGVEDGSITFDICRKLVDEWVLVGEEEIAVAMMTVLKYHHKVLEGAAGASVASYLKESHKYVGKKVVVVCCGSNLALRTLDGLIQQHGRSL